MRSVDSRSSATRPWAVERPLLSSTAAGVAGPASAAMRPASRRRRRPRPAARRGANASATPSARARSRNSSSASAASSAVERGALCGVAHGLLAELGDRPAPARSTPASTNALSVEPITSSASASWAADAPGRRGRVVQLVGQSRGHRAQRGQALPVLLDRGDPAHERADLMHDPAVHGGVGERERPELGRRDEGRRHGVAATIRTPTGASVRAAMAPIHVGACLVAVGSSRVAVATSVCTSPRAGRSCPRWAGSASTTSHPPRAPRGCAAAAHSAARPRRGHRTGRPARSSRRAVAGRLMPRPGIRE